MMAAVNILLLAALAMMGLVAVLRIQPKERFQDSYHLRTLQSVADGGEIPSLTKEEQAVELSAHCTEISNESPLIDSKAALRRRRAYQ
jgi:cytochrome c-type biogenesis protein CcmH/NrfF